MAKNRMPLMDNILPYSKVAAKLSLREKVGQLFMPAAFINDTEESIQQLENLLQTSRVGGLCFFHSRASAATNFEGPKKVIYNQNSLETLRGLILRYQNASRIPLLISIDAEWGLAMRIENTPQFPYAITLGALQDNEELIFEVGRHIANDCRQAGIHWNFAPVADINLNPQNPVIGYRSFGEDKQEVAKKAIALMRGMQSGGILTAAKHFPGHGDTGTDSHLGLPVISKGRAELLENELFPFQLLIQAGVDAIMIGHLSVPALEAGPSVPATLSRKIIRDILRKEMGFKGVVVSDALNMHSVSRLFPEKGALEWNAFQAGNEVLCFAEHVKEGIDMILKKASKDQIELAFKNVWQLKEKAYTMPVTREPGTFNHEALNQKLAAASLTMVRGDQATLNGFREQGYSALEISSRAGQPFLTALKDTGILPDPFNLDPVNELPVEFNHPNENILVALYPPSIKPVNSFGISPVVVEAINRFLATNKVVLYLFGNPYVLRLFNYEQAVAVVIAYQDFKSFQLNAARHFLGNSQASGKLPVTLKADSI